MSKRRLAIGVVAAAAVLLGGRALSLLYDSFTWYDSLGARSLWMEKVVDSAVVAIVGFFLAFIFTLANLAAVGRSIGSFTRPRRLANVEFGEAVPPTQLRIAAVAISGAIALGLMRLLPSWETLALAKMGIDFREADPYLHHDLSFYVAWLPLERATYAWTLALIVAVSVCVLALYLFAEGVRWSDGVLRLTPSARKHLGVLVAIALLMCSWSYRLDSYDLRSGAGHYGSGFGHLDHTWFLPGLLALSLATAAAAITVALSAWMGQLRTSFIAIMFAIGAAAVVKEIVPFTLLRSTTQKEEAAANAPYAATRADFSRRAFGAEVETEQGTESQFAMLPAISQPRLPGPDTLVAPGASGTRVVNDPTLDIAAPSLGRGVPRLAHAWAARNFGLLADTLHRRSRIVSVRDVRTRVAKLYPFFFAGPSSRPSFRADTLYWSVPLYATSASYPLAAPREIWGESRTYFHRAGTALVNARTGRVYAALDLPPEPVAAGWLRRFTPPGALTSAKALQHALSVSSELGSSVPPQDTSFRSGVIRLYDRMRAALSAGDLRGFGLAYDSLGALVGRARK